MNPLFLSNSVLFLSRRGPFRRNPNPQLIIRYQSLDPGNQQSLSHDLPDWYYLDPKTPTPETKAQRLWRHRRNVREHRWQELMEKLGVLEPESTPRPWFKDENDRDILTAAIKYYWALKNSNQPTEDIFNTITSSSNIPPMKDWQLKRLKDTSSVSSVFSSWMDNNSSLSSPFHIPEIDFGKTSPVNIDNVPRVIRRRWFKQGKIDSPPQDNVVQYDS